MMADVCRVSKACRGSERGGGGKLSEGQDFSCEELSGSTCNLQSKYKLYAYNESNRIVTLCLLL